MSGLDDTSWSVEQVDPAELAAGDVVKIKEEWLQVTRVVEAGEDQPAWERPLGKWAVLLAPVSGDGATRLAYANEFPSSVTRKVSADG